ncbi:site-specific integrase [Paraburkholderia franconis]|uniref:site-specific integrase n=1 Tax=Paraburkholderia franconis TaxID=2654983 RepID=UPI00187B930B
MSNITRDDIRQLVDALRRERLSEHTIVRELLILRAFFNHARNTWLWTEPEENPAIMHD